MNICQDWRIKNYKVLSIQHQILYCVINDEKVNQKIILPILDKYSDN